ncbi:hypothetical protein EYF80_052372 [Liparis tanakae]|uniref:Uncharacterized protein n=1 Tax=Liparis tanakae TaxID=230148 RepID=A0A4Z2F8B2_9TELE|nr:hypothetical protein EYF80_052372 [Liparis tanakae]
MSRALSPSFRGLDVSILESVRSPLGPVLGVYLVSRLAALCRVQSKSSFLSCVNMQMGSSSKLQWNSSGERQSRTALTGHGKLETISTGVKGRKNDGRHGNAEEQIDIIGQIQRAESTRTDTRELFGPKDDRLYL